MGCELLLESPEARGLGEGGIKTSPNYKCAEELAWRKWEDYTLEELGSSSKTGSLKGTTWNYFHFKLRRKTCLPS